MLEGKIEGKKLDKEQKVNKFKHLKVLKEQLVLKEEVQNDAKAKKKKMNSKSNNKYKRGR